MIQWHQHASGEFSAPLIEGTRHCGLSYGAGIGQFKFSVDITYDGDAHPLDPNGFLIDNTAFQSYFQHLPPISVSCELLAKQAAKDLVGMLGDRASAVCECKVAIYPFGDTSVAFSQSCRVDRETVSIGGDL